MKKENSEKLVELYPEMFTFSVRGYKYNAFERIYNKSLAFIHKHLKFTRSINYIKQVNPYNYQFEVGDGWYGILYELILNIKFNDDAKGDWITKLTQCKEKFGGLRFYVTGTSDRNWKLIHKAEEKSYSVCEVTGSQVEIGIWNDGWIQTICRKEALRRFYELSDKKQLKDGQTFDSLWKPKEKAVVIETPKKKTKK
jgi:hypothetical protein